jgi:hypothetical protein
MHIHKMKTERRYLTLPVASWQIWKLETDYFLLRLAGAS